MLSKKLYGKPGNYKMAPATRKKLRELQKEFPNYHNYQFLNIGVWLLDKVKKGGKINLPALNSNDDIEEKLKINMGG